MAVLQDKRGRWCFDFYDPLGRRRRRVCPDLEAARALDAEHRRRQRRARATREAAAALEPLTLAAALERFFLSGVLSAPNTRRLRDHLQPLTLHCRPDRLLSTITGETLNAYLTALRHHGFAPHTLYTARWSLARFFLWCVREGYLLASPHRDCPPIPRPHPRATLPTAPELNTMIQRADPLLRRAILLGAHAGLRSGEVVSARWLDLHDQFLHVHTTKHGPPAVVWLSPQLRASLHRGPIPTPMQPRAGAQVAAYTRAGRTIARSARASHPLPNGHELLVPLTRSALIARFRLHRHACGVARPVRFHDLRHWLGTTLARQGESESIIARVLRHRAPWVTRHYINLADHDSARALMKLHGLAVAKGA